MDRRATPQDDAGFRPCRPRSFPSIAWRALLASRKPLHADALPPLGVTLRNVIVDPVRVARYRKVCGAEGEGPVPPVFAHVLAGPAQLTLLTHRDFPLRVLGTVHVRNRCRQRRALTAGEVVEIRARLGSLRETQRGAEHDLVTEVVDAGGVAVWSGESTFLVVDRALPRVPPGDLEEPQYEHLVPIAVPASVGRRYGRVSGDLNPIHVHPALARLFGLRRAIAHGMWTLARSLVALEGRLTRSALAVDASFRKPLFIPAGVALHWADGGDGLRFAVKSADGKHTHVEGVISPEGGAS